MDKKNLFEIAVILVVLVAGLFFIVSNYSNAKTGPMNASVSGLENTENTETKSNQNSFTENHSAETSGNRGKAGMAFFEIEENFIAEDDVSPLSEQGIKELGVKIVRVNTGVLWGKIETEKGEFDFSGPDNQAIKAANAGVSIIFTVFPYAKWDQGHLPECRSMQPGKNSNEGYLCKPQDMDAYKNFVKELTERYDGDEDFGSFAASSELKEAVKKSPVMFYEINNEPDMPNHFIGTTKDYVDSLKASFEAVKSACQECSVIVAAPVMKNTEAFYTELLFIGAEKYFDIYNLHDYFSPNKELFKGKEKPVWISESPRETTGLYTAEEIAFEMAKTAIDSALEGVTCIGISTSAPKDKFEHKSKSMGENEEQFFYDYLLDQEGRKTLNFKALKALIANLEGFESAWQIYAETLDAEMIKFSFKESKPVYVFFNEYKKVFIPLEAKKPVSDLYGNEITIENNGFYAEPNNMYFLKSN